MATIPPISPPQDAVAEAPTPATGIANGAPRPFEVTAIEQTDAPEGATGADWHRYVLHNGSSTIVGQRQGPREEVAAYAAHCAEQLNARGFRGQSVWAPRTKPVG